ncbi:MAG: amidohydrolase family protein [Acidobacteriota bacterium]|nr:amidohydrolase family protein [Acidobacteriota bacterium]
MTAERIGDLQAIDIHGHFGVYTGAKTDLINGFYSGGIDVVLRRARLARIGHTFISPLAAMFPQSVADALAANADFAAAVGGYPAFSQWAVLDPRKPGSFDQVEELLKTPKCIGIKIHPEQHVYPIKEHGRRIFEFAARLGAVVQSHSGGLLSMPEDFVPFADEFPGATLILSHIGWSPDVDLTHQVKAMTMSRHGNICADTSSSFSITSNLIEWAVREAGAERVFFGSDTPLYFSPMQRERIDSAEIDDRSKRLILRGNAERLFKIGGHNT